MRKKTQLEPFEVPIPNTPFESDGELNGGDDVVIVFCLGMMLSLMEVGIFDLWEMEIPLETKTRTELAVCSISR